jgi:hypothetical protein
LLAAAIEPDALNIRDAREPGWQQALPLSAMIITDVVTARKLPPNCAVRIFSVIADSSLDELRKSFDLA